MGMTLQGHELFWELSKLEILRQGKEYNYSDNRPIPAFSYQSQDDPNLIRIRKELKLDSIAVGWH